jgi:SWIM zinc finger
MKSTAPHTVRQPARHPWRHGSGWRVPSASRTDVVHFVSGDLRRCTCAAWAYGRGEPCQHIRVVRAFTKEVTMGD